MTTKIGVDGVLNYKVAGISSANQWTELTIARDVTLDLDKGEADNTTRGSGGWTSTKGTLKNASIDVEVKYDVADAGFIAFRDAYLNNQRIGVQILDGASGNGFQGDFEVLKMSLPQPLDGVQLTTFNLKLTYEDTAPSWI